MWTWGEVSEGKKAGMGGFFDEGFGRRFGPIVLEEKVYGCGNVCSGMAEPLGVEVWKVWADYKDDARWAADLERVLSGRSAAEKQEAFHVVVRVDEFICRRGWNALWARQSRSCVS